MSTILIVDDEPKMRELMVRWLTPSGHEIKQAGDAAAALEIVRTTGADVVVSDISMPGNDGVWLVTRLRAEFPQVAIVLATASDALPGSVSLQEGVVGYLLKPFSASRVHKAVKEALQWREKAIARAAQPTPPGDPVAEWLNAPPRPLPTEDDE